MTGSGRFLQREPARSGFVFTLLLFGALRASGWSQNRLFCKRRIPRWITDQGGAGSVQRVHCPFW